MGYSGTGKTTIVNKKLKNLPHDKFLVVKIIFTFQTSPHRVQENIELNFERKRKGAFGPPKNGQRCQVFIDDLNVPNKDKYGA